MKTFLMSLAITFISCTTSTTQFYTGSNISISPHYGAIPMLQGSTGTDFTEFNILSGKGTRWSFRITPHAPGINIKEIAHPPSLYKIYKLKVTRLKPDTTYTLAVANRRGETIEQRFFKTFPKNKNNLRFAFGSCMNDSVAFFEVANKIWQQVGILKADMIVLAGDNVYVDEWHFLGKKVLPQANQIWQRYAHAFNSTPLFKFKNLIPILATWDDHDYGSNNSDKSWGKVRNNWNPAKEAKKSFEAFFGSTSSNHHNQKGPGASSRTDVAGHRFVFLDNRTFRTPNNMDYGHWGEKQERFLLQQIENSSKPLFIVNGGQFFGGYLEKESVEYNHPVHFQEFKKRLKKLYRENPQLPPFALISGDVHFSEVMKVEKEQFGFQTYEFTSSPWYNRLRRVHSSPKYSSKRNFRRIKSIEGPNFLFAQSSYQDNILKVNIKAYGPKGAVQGSHLSLSIDRE